MSEYGIFDYQKIKDAFKELEESFAQKLNEARREGAKQAFNEVLDFRLERLMKTQNTECSNNEIKDFILKRLAELEK
jgi:hypothetical protein